MFLDPLYLDMLCEGKRSGVVLRLVLFYAMSKVQMESSSIILDPMTS